MFFFVFFYINKKNTNLVLKGELLFSLVKQVEVIMWSLTLLLE